MRVYILFGKAGCGKSFVGDFLQNRYNWLHFDADQLITDEMKECIRLEKQMSVQLIDEYMEIVKAKISYFYEAETKPVAISQAMYRNKNRLDLLKEFPRLKFIWIKADDQIYYKRIKQRHNNITVNYAQKISPLFEPPAGFSYLLLENNHSPLQLSATFEQSILLSD